VKESSSAISVARGASYLLIQNIASTIISIAAFALIARLITQAEMGVLATLTLTAGACQLIASLGLPSAATKFIAEYMGKDDRQTASSVFYQILRVSLTLSVALALLCFIFSNIISLYLLKTRAYTKLFQVLTFDIVLTAGILPCLTQSLLGLQKIREIATFNITSLAIRQTLIVSLLFSGYGLTGLVIAWCISDLVNCTLGTSLILKTLGSPTSSFSLRHLLKFSSPLFVSGIATFSYDWFDRVLLLAFVSLNQLGVYNVALTAFGVLAGIPGAISTALFPKYSEIHGREGTKAVENAIHTASRYVCYITIPLALGLLATANPAISLLAGEAYTTASQPLAILSLFFAASCVSAALSGLFLILEQTPIASGLTIINVIAGITFTVLFLPIFGITGAAIARGIAMLLGLALSVSFLKKRINLKLDREALGKSLIAGLAMAAAVSLVEYVWYSKYLLPLYALTGGLTYLTMLRVLHAATKTDIQLIQQYLGKRLKPLTKPIGTFLLGKEQY